MNAQTHTLRDCEWRRFTVKHCCLSIFSYKKKRHLKKNIRKCQYRGFFWTFIPMSLLISTTKTSWGRGQVNSTEVLVGSSRVWYLGLQICLDSWVTHTLQSGSSDTLLMVMMVSGSGVTDIILPPKGKRSISRYSSDQRAKTSQMCVHMNKS